MAETSDIDAQDVAEVFDEDNTNIESERQNGAEDNEQLEDLVDVFDVTTRVGDRSDEEGAIGEDMDDDEIIAAAQDEDVDDQDLEDDELAGREPEEYDTEDELDGLANADIDDLDDVDGIDALDPDEVELEYDGDLANMENATSSAADMESDTLSDDDLRDLDYKKD
ncbi:MAG: hypothetical protein ACYDD1_06675 [Caulobacteraceae bacterium]